MLRISAALILVRQNPIRVLLLKRNDNLSFGGSFAFPGGSLETSDNQDKSNAAVRECWEEAGIKVNKNSLKPFIRIITPQFMKKRYDTQFYVSNVTDQQNLDDLQIDLKENSSYEWNTPSNFITKFIQKEITLFPPIFLQLLILQQLGNNYWDYISNLPNDVHSFPTIFQFSKQQGCNVILSYGDKEFDVQKLIANEQDKQLQEEFIQKMKQKWESDNRILFKDHLQFFQSFIGDYRSSPLSLLASVNIKDGIFQNSSNPKI